MINLDSAHLASLIRQQVAALRRPAGGRSAASPPSSLQSPASVMPQTDTRDLAALVASRVRAIDPDDPEKRSKTMRIFLETVLLAELGESLSNDAAFHQLLGDVQREMESDPQIARAMDAATHQMLTARS